MILYPPTPADSKGERAREEEFPISNWCKKLKRLSAYLLKGRISRDTFFRQFCGAICWLLRPSLPWCFRLAGPMFWQPGKCNLKRVSSWFSKISEDTLGTFSVRFAGFSVLHCHGVSSWRVQCFGGLEGVTWSTFLAFSAVSEHALGTFSVRFTAFSVLHCHGVSGWRVQCFGSLEDVSWSSFLASSLHDFRRCVRHFFAAICWFRRPSLPWCLRLAGPELFSS